MLPAPTSSALSDVRARYLSERFDVPFAEARTDFLTRDAVVKAHAFSTTVSIWLEHDLYDQLQLLADLVIFRG